MNHAKFVTSSLPLAAFLVASGSLPLREVRLIDLKRAAFIFDDPQGRGPDLERKFEAGALVSALAFHTQLRILRRAIDNEMQTAGLGVTRRDHIQGKHHVHFANQR